MKKSVDSIMNENQILDQLNHKFIINKKSSFQDKNYLYLLMDLATGGDLRFHMCVKKTFNENQIKFFAACLMESMKFIHGKGFIHRDIKPENIVFEEKGYLRLTDFGISKKRKINNMKNTSGTPGYMAPEVLFHQNHSYEVDYFALGVILYECVVGKRPYLGASRQDIRDAIVESQVQIDARNVNWSSQGIDFINQLIQRKPYQRLGSEGIEQLYNHPWFSGFDWEKLRSKKMKTPFKPNIKQVYCYMQSLTMSTQEVEPQYKQALKNDNIQALFKGYESTKQNVTKPKSIVEKIFQTTQIQKFK